MLDITVATKEQMREKEKNCGSSVDFKDFDLTKEISSVNNAKHVLQFCLY